MWPPQQAWGIWRMRPALCWRHKPNVSHNFEKQPRAAHLARLRKEHCKTGAPQAAAGAKRCTCGQCHTGELALEQRESSDTSGYARLGSAPHDYSACDLLLKRLRVAGAPASRNKNSSFSHLDVSPRLATQFCPTTPCKPKPAPRGKLYRVKTGIRRRGTLIKRRAARADVGSTM